MNITEYIKRENAILDAKLQNPRTLFSLKFSYDEYKELIRIFATEIMLDRSNNQRFIIDKKNENIIQQLFYYSTGNNEFQGNLKKGILLAGSYGTGKTLLMSAFIKIINNSQFDYLIKARHSKEIYYDFAYETEDPLRKMISTHRHEKRRILFFVDDIGKEHTKVLNFGSEINPIMDLISLMYEQNRSMFATTNLNTSALKEKYTGHIGERITEMFNIIELVGDSRRN